MKKLIACALASMCSFFATNANAMDCSVVFKEGKNRIHFTSQGITLAGHLYLPSGFNAAIQYPTVIYSGPMTQIKEQTGAVYGAKLADKGYAVLAFDHAGFGESEGTVRNYENPYIKMENIRDGISYLGTLPFVNDKRIYGLGVCASGSYMALVATTDKRLAAIATVSGMMDNDALFFNSLSRDQVISLLKSANESRQKTYETGEIEYVDAMGLEQLDPSVLDKESVFYNARDFYLTKRGGAETYPRYSHKGPVMARELGALVSAMPHASHLYTPYLGVYGEKAIIDTAPQTIAFYEAASEPKELFEVAGANHVSLYDNEEHVNSAIAEIDTFFKKYSQK